MIHQLNIHNRLALVLWGTALLAFIVAGAGLLLYQNFTLESRAQQIMEPYAHLVSVGTDSAVAFEDPIRAQEILDTLRANPQILAADIFLDSGQTLASYNHRPVAKPEPPPDRPDGIYLTEDTAELVQSLPSGAHLRLSIGLDQLGEQTRQTIWMFAVAVFILLAVTLAQLTVLRRTLTRPILALMKATEQVQTKGDYKQRVPASGTDEVARLGQNFNLMMETIQNREDDLHHITQFRRTILDDAAYGIISVTPDGTVSSFNPAAEHLLGYTAEEIIGKQTPVLWHDADEVARYARQLSEELGETVPAGFDVFIARPQRGLKEENEWTYIRKDGSRLPVNISVTALHDENQRITGYVGMIYDLTERKQTEASLLRLNRELRAISDCNQILVRAKDEQSLLNDICRIVCEEAGYRMAWVGYAENDDARSIRPVAWGGVEDGYLEQINISWADKEQGRGPTGTAFRSGQSAVIQDFTLDPRVALWREDALLRGYRSCLSLVLKDDRDQTFGVFTIYSTEPDIFVPEEVRLLEELAADLAFGITTLRRRDEHDRAEEQIRIAATAFEAQEGIIITDAEQKILRVNYAFTEITGYSAEEAVGATPDLLKSEHHDSAYFKKMWDCVQRDGVWQDEIWNRRKNGEVYPGWLNITAVKNPSGEITHYVGTMTDITERKAAEAEIEHLAFHDSLTLLPNRRLLLDRLDQTLAASARNQNRGALLFIDLDNFKILNDTRGHDAGDQLLIEVARRLTVCVRKVDTIARFGGDEFMIMLNDLGKNTKEAAEQSKRVGEKILSELDQPYMVAGQVHHITPSVGVTLFIGAQNSVADLMKQADIAMYQAKSKGGNTLRFFDPEMQATLAERAALETALRKAVEEHQFVLHYQPQVNNVRGIIGAELLLRWDHPERGIVSPADFIPLAEETGLILPIGQWVLQTACRQLKKWENNPDTCELQLAVNVSQRQFRHGDFVDQVQLALENSGASASHLKIELTESLLIDNIDDSIKKMHALKALGVGFSLDDFGTGYSSLSYLTRLPLDQLKIDMSFIRNLPDNHNDAVVAQTIITMGKSLEMGVIAEGVETESQRQFLEQHGCSTYQGYLFSKPVCLHDFEALLTRKSKAMLVSSSNK